MMMPAESELRLVQEEYENGNISNSIVTSNRLHAPLPPAKPVPNIVPSRLAMILCLPAIIPNKKSNLSHLLCRDGQCLTL